jgi:regulatory protein YycI of two-component signal transduction system YycFG
MTIINGGKLAIWDFDKDTKVISKSHKYDNFKVNGLEGSVVKLLNDPNQPTLFLALSTRTAMVRLKPIIHTFLFN